MCLPCHGRSNCSAVIMPRLYQVASHDVILQWHAVACHGMQVPLILALHGKIVKGGDYPSDRLFPSPTEADEGCTNIHTPSSLSDRQCAPPRLTRQPHKSAAPFLLLRTKTCLLLQQKKCLRRLRSSLEQRFRALCGFKVVFEVIVQRFRTILWL